MIDGKRRKEEKRIKDEDLFKVVDSTIDSRTYLSLIQLARKLQIKEYYGAISSGKEAKIYPALTKDGTWYAVKIYYVTTAASKRALEKYTIGDPRFKDVKIKTTFQLIETWARKEYKNLVRLYEAGVSSPRPIFVYRNILVMDFIGQDGIRAPLLKELSEEEINEDLYRKVIGELEKMVNIAHLVHGDLSEYNIMVWDEKPYIIDVSQSVDLQHPNALELLKRDIENINRFFEDHNISVELVEDILSRLKISNVNSDDVHDSPR
ncbi:serine protein kinase RIO [Stygiolobus caldivivus]|uniref:non-specific serine/threonine protein kinase n=1 Tax=Stygiolobus caldivivus TaxID=2824673 RepID=A0A8D5U430_9CREN|nr:serine protein kinase RIO [Stygiolobus caldivivus]BCU69011.1 serine/threonine protein kinase [Stygiolobus caldivivus]